jgi:hypothetical protein
MRREQRIGRRGYAGQPQARHHLAYTERTLGQNRHKGTHGATARGCGGLWHPMTGSSALAPRIASSVLIALGLLCFAAARRMPQYLAKRGISTIVAYGHFVFYAAAVVFGPLGAC